ncbi:hypothetical protein EVAR_49409_1 [Eumeta japonica]|uniref:Uncharacterized protein n=1 Tax=Eumeta variegata TaxID=151549 RepID=A0A4C1Y4B7_EUMVA|nr:hypothetical protein EVAR_49409_1 [Eumeta japonica]
MSDCAHYGVPKPLAEGLQRNALQMEKTSRPSRSQLYYGPIEMSRNQLKWRANGARPYWAKLIQIQSSPDSKRRLSTFHWRINEVCAPRPLSEGRSACRFPAPAR